MESIFGMESLQTAPELHQNSTNLERRLNALPAVIVPSCYLFTFVCGLCLQP